jgi:hypothetical protein
MRIRAARVTTVWIIAAVVASAVATCVPGAMDLQASRGTACAGMAGMGDDESRVSSALPSDCCTHHEPSLTSSKADLLNSPQQDTSSWVAWLAPVTIVPTKLSIITAESPPELISTLGPPTYIVLSTLRI